MSSISSARVWRSLGEASATGSVSSTVLPRLPSAPLIAWTSTCSSRPRYSPAHHHRGGRLRLQVGGHLFDPGGQLFVEGGRGRRTGDAQAGGQGEQELPDLARLDRQAVVGHRAGAGGNGLERIEPAHPPRGIEIVRLAAGREVARVGDREGAVVEEVGVDRQHHVGFGEVVARARRGRRRRAAPAASPAPSSGSSICHLALGSSASSWPIRRPKVGELVRPVTIRRPSPCTGPSAMRRASMRFTKASQVLPRAELADRHRAVRIVEVEHRSLDDRVGAAAAGRMQLVAFDLGRPPHVAFRRGRRSRSPGRAWRWRRTAACRARCPRAGARKARPSPAAACRRPRGRRAPARRWSAGGSDGGRRCPIPPPGAGIRAAAGRRSSAFSPARPCCARGARPFALASRARTSCGAAPSCSVCSVLRSVHRYRLVLSDQRWQVEQLKSLSLPARFTCSARWA